MSSTNSHMLVQPKAMFVLRCVQLATAVAVMGLAAYGITFLSFDGIDLMMFTAIATMIITVYVIVAETAVPALYNYWAILGLDIFAIVFWLVSFAYLASEVGPLYGDTYYSSYSSSSSDCSYYYAGYCIYKRDAGIAKRATTDYDTWRNSMAAASGLGGLEFILFIVTLVFTALALHKHRKAGGHCMPASTETSAGNIESGYGAPSIATTAVEHEKPQPVYNQAAQPMHAAGQPTYA